MKILLNYFLKTDYFDLGAGYGFAWCELTSGYSSIFTGLGFQVPKVLYKRNPYSVNRLWIIPSSSYIKCFICYDNLYRLDFLKWVSQMRHLRRMAFSTCSLSNSSSFRKFQSLNGVQTKMSNFLCTLSFQCFLKL